MNNLDKQYQNLLQDILDNGVIKKDRTGTGTISVFGRQIRHKMSEGFPLLTTKKMYMKGIITELLWFLRGETNIKYLVDNDCHIWDGDAYKSYLQHTILGVNNGFDKIKGHLDNCLVEFEGEYEHFTNPSFRYGFRPHTKEEFINKIKTDDEFAKKWGDLGPIYGRQWRRWENYGYRGVQSGALDCGLISTEEYEKKMYVDQIQNLINDLKTNPDSRRLMVSAWNVAEINQMTLPPCHYGFQVYTRELSLEERGELFIKTYPDKSVDDFAQGGMEVQSLIHQLNTRYNNANIPARAISLMWNQRSVDTFLGLPFNIASYGLLLEIIAKEVNMVPDELIGNLGDTHLYLNHIEQAKEQIGREYTPNERSDMLKDVMSWRLYNKAINEGNDMSEYYETYKIPKHTREPYPLPNLVYLDEYNYLTDKEIVGEISFSKKITKFIPDFFGVENYQSHPPIKAPLSN